MLCAVASNASNVAGGIDASSSVVLMRNERRLSSLIFSTMLGGNGGSTAVVQEQDTENMRHGRLTEICILICMEFLWALTARGRVKYFRTRHATSTDSQGPNTHSDIMRLAGMKQISQIFHSLSGDINYPGQKLGVGKPTIVASNCHG